MEQRRHDVENGLPFVMGPDLDQLQVRFAIDATSVAGDADHAKDAPLFAFRGRNASPIGKGIYPVQGEFAGAAGEHPLMVQLETLNEHSALFLLSFQADKADFGPSWTQLLSNVVPFAYASRECAKIATV